MPLAHRGEHLDHLAVQQAVIPGVELDVEVGQAPDAPVKPLGGGDLEAALAPAFVADGVHDLGAEAPLADQLGDQLGWVLEIGVDDDHRVAAGAVQPGGDRHLMAEVARQGDDADPRVGVGERRQLGVRAVGRTVVDVDDLAAVG